ncbi:hypothetical protein Taro_036084 [Colocasia esculenta]|uniref:Uncharacterized protein n=1 Tax=Colocasia esculenta TaxID=4460 RepID=A0A843WF96_COLES|nr:hypothetical protein [Colocasia esculenta]
MVDEYCALLFCHEQGEVLPNFLAHPYETKILYKIKRLQNSCWLSDSAVLQQPGRLSSLPTHVAVSLPTQQSADSPVQQDPADLAAWPTLVASRFCQLI